MSLQHVLATEVMRESAPEVLAGQGALDRSVRWVHSSEIYEIAPLLSGGELLLTTGLGLATVDALAKRHYIRDLAQRGVAGVALEIGRSFDVVPPEMLEEARKHGFPVIALRAVTPFVRLTEVINTALVDYSARGQRLPESMTRALNEALISGSSVAELLSLAARFAGCPLVLAMADDQVVAHSGDSELTGTARAVRLRAAAEVTVSLHGGDWGHLVAGPGSNLSERDLEQVLEQTALALVVALLRTGNPPAHRDRQTAVLLGDLVEGQPLSEADVHVRAQLCGFTLRPDQRLTGVAVHALSAAPALRLIDTAAQLLGQPALRAAVNDGVLALLPVGRHHVDAIGSVRHALAEAAGRQDASDVTVVVGPVTHGAQGWSAVAETLRDARSGLSLATRRAGRGDGAHVVATRELEMELLLSRTASGQAGQLASRVLGPLIEWDSTHGTALVHTLEAYLVHGSSATRTAAALFVGRQALYQRLERIETLLGHSPSDPRLHRTLLLAACAHRL
jgi:purine catabolism regulator